MSLLVSDLYQFWVCLDICKYFINQIANIWNSFPDRVVAVPSIKSCVDICRSEPSFWPSSPERFSEFIDWRHSKFEHKFFALIGSAMATFSNLCLIYLFLPSGLCSPKHVCPLFPFNHLLCMSFNHHSLICRNRMCYLTVKVKILQCWTAQFSFAENVHVLFLSFNFSVTPCASNPCQNGATCLTSTDHNSYRCLCPSPQFIGSRCEVGKVVC